VTVGAGSDPRPVNAGTITARTITTAAPISSIPTGCRYHGDGPPGGRDPFPDGGGRYPHGSRGLAISPHGRSGTGSAGGVCGWRPHGCPPHGGGCGGCCGGCSTRWVSLLVLTARVPGQRRPSL
jgi:hypothetical protein